MDKIQTAYFSVHILYVGPGYFVQELYLISSTKLQFTIQFKTNPEHKARVASRTEHDPVLETKMVSASSEDVSS